ncbi:MAG: ribosome silencing factor [Akkermansia sp.]
MAPIKALDLAKACALAAQETKAENIVLYDLRDISSLTDYALVCTGLSVPHIRGILKDIEQEVYEKTGVDSAYQENKAATLWSVIDYIDVMVHIMGTEARDHYALDELWRKAPIINI